MEVSISHGSLYSTHCILATAYHLEGLFLEISTFVFLLVYPFQEIRIAKEKPVFNLEMDERHPMFN